MTESSKALNRSGFCHPGSRPRPTDVSLHADMRASQSCCTSVRRISCYDSSLLNWGLLRLEATSVTVHESTHGHSPETSVRWCDLCDRVHYPAGSSPQEMVHGGHGGSDMVSNHIQGGCSVDRCSAGTEGPEVGQETLHPPLHHQSEVLIPGRMGLRCPSARCHLSGNKHWYWSFYELWPSTEPTELGSYWLISRRVIAALQQPAHVGLLLMAEIFCSVFKH